MDATARDLRYLQSQTLQSSQSRLFNGCNKVFNVLLQTAKLVFSVGTCDYVANVLLSKLVLQAKQKSLEVRQ